MLLPSLHVKARPLSTGAMAVFPWSENLARRFSLVTRFGDPYSLFRKDGDNILLPRETCQLGYEDERVSGKPVAFDLVIGPKNEEQKRLSVEINHHLANGTSHIVRAPTGTGKTWLACSAMATVKRKALILVHKEDLIDQWRSALIKFLGLAPHEIGLVQADKVSVVGKKVVIAMIHSVAIPDRYDRSVFEDFGLLIPDEVHTCAADTLSQSLMHVPARLRLGLSATQRRQGPGSLCSHRPYPGRERRLAADAQGHDVPDRV